MKKIILLFAAVMVTLFAFSQTQMDALRYSQIEYSGTARFVGMGSSFGALGTDLSALAINPAGVALYRAGEINMTPALVSTRIESKFSNNLTQDFAYGFNFSNLGVAFSYVDDNTSGWKGVAFGFSYNRINNFNRSIVIEGSNTEGSMIGNFVDNANSGQYGVFYEKPAFETYLIDFDENVKEYFSPITDLKKYNQLQKKTIYNKGGMGEYDFALGINYEDLIYIGTNLGVQTANYTEFATYREEFAEYSETYLSVTDTSGYYIPSPDFFTIEEDLTTNGSGVNIKLGMIARPLDWARIGIAYHSPTFFSLQDMFTTTFYSHYDNGKTTINGQIVDKKPLPDGKYSAEYETTDTEPYTYELTTPARAIGSLGFVIKKFALINLEAEHVDYSIARYRKLYDANDDIQTDLTSAINLRGGMEIRLGALAIRGGFGYYGNPYNTKLNRTDATKYIFSGGLGIVSEDFYIDFAYSQAIYKDDYFMYNGTANELHASLNFARGIGLVTFGMRFD